ncbi:MAG TPA: cell envelope integrity EipB family protein [Rhodopila sp.]|uniref:cell envelope integrity EipB family protein n=1 Tax=Rhodopila sp. TaxID=2480087 RepID=UPI002C77B8C8|nr:cell envelope integrity EipB family protein [Rhodopila sp.]HVY17473.1 cell envelope integrity EipB family protein [Rhodopila sp.]
MRLSAALTALLMTGALAGPPAVAANTPPPAALPPSAMLAHRALYTLTLARAKSQDVIAAHGTMGYAVADACDGWTSEQRLRMTVTNADGQEIEMASDYATWEAKNGLKFRFHMRQTTDTAVSSQTDGEATLTKAGGPGEVHYTLPKDKTVPLPAGTVFPMAHTETLLAAALHNQRFLNLPLFDGTDENGVEDSFIIALDQKPPMHTAYPVLSALPSARVHISFFDHDVKSMMPTYEVTMRYWENGVADNMTMDFGDFVMNAKLKEFAPQPKRC